MRILPNYVCSNLRSAVDFRIGELIRNGAVIYYAILAGGFYFEHAVFAEVAAYVEAEERAKLPTK